MDNETKASKQLAFPDIQVRPIEPADGPQLVQLFERESCGCFCRYWHFSGTNKEWESRVGLNPDENRRELELDLTLRLPAAQGVIAIDAGRALGWLKLIPRHMLPKLLSRHPYRDLEEQDPSVRVLSIGCLLVDSTCRRQDLSRLLLKGAISHARVTKATAIEAYPRRIEGAAHDGELFMGPESIYTDAGFSLVRDASQYPVLRLQL